MVDYGKKLEETREAEQAFLAGVVKSAGKSTPMPDTAEAIAALAPEPYEIYAENVRQAAAMHEAIMGHAVTQELQEPRLPKH